MSHDLIHCGGQSLNMANVTHFDWSLGADGHAAVKINTSGGHAVAVEGAEADELAEKLGWNAHLKAREAARLKAEKEAEAEAEKAVKEAEKEAKVEAKAAEKEAKAEAKVEAAEEHHGFKAKR